MRSCAQCVLTARLFFSLPYVIILLVCPVTNRIRLETELANIKSQKKRVRTNEKAHKRNVAYKSELKTYIRKTREAIAAGNKANAEAAYAVAARKLDKAASRGVIHKNQAANRKSALALAINAL